MFATNIVAPRIRRLSRRPGAMPPVPAHHLDTVLVSPVMRTRCHTVYLSGARTHADLTMSQIRKCCFPEDDGTIANYDPLHFNASRVAEDVTDCVAGCHSVKLVSLSLGGRVACDTITRLRARYGDDIDISLMLLDSPYNFASIGYTGILRAISVRSAHKASAAYHRVLRHELVDEIRDLSPVMAEARELIRLQSKLGYPLRGYLQQALYLRRCSDLDVAVLRGVHIVILQSENDSLVNRKKAYNDWSRAAGHYIPLITVKSGIRAKVDHASVLNYAFAWLRDINLANGILAAAA